VPEPAAPATQTKSSALTLLKYVAPIYPTEAQARDLEGWVQVSLQVTPSGDVVKARVEDGQKRQLFARAALSAVRQWKYEPRPDASGETPVIVRLDFKLEPLKH
jgi:periplasmic protein TonB